MADLSEGLIPRPDDGLGYSRAFCESVGKLEALCRGDRVRIWYAGCYHAGRVTRSLPGGCYWAAVEHLHSGLSGLTVSCSNFGGRIHD